MIEITHIFSQNIKTQLDYALLEAYKKFKIKIKNIVFRT